MSINVHAAATPVEWWGTDFNPSQAGFAQQLARESGACAHLFDESFAEFCARPDVPQMDYIGLHGIWSWVSDENRRLIVDFVRRKLNVGGVLYVSYNTQPGWATMVPVRDLFVDHASAMGARGQGRLAQVDAALAFVQKLFDANPAFSRVNPTVVERLKGLAAHNRAYLAHEYFNRDWEPMSFANMARWLEPAKLSYACSAHPLDQVDSLNLSAEQQALLAGIPDANFRQTVRDFCVNQQFRKDFWVKGARTMGPAERLEGVRKLAWVLTVPPGEVTMKVTGAQGEASLNEAIYSRILGALADHQPRTFADLADKIGDKVTVSQLNQALMVLASKAAVRSVQDPGAAAQAKAGAAQLNRHLLDMARFVPDVQVLASPVLGGGVALNRFEQLFLASFLAGNKSPEDWTRDAWAVMTGQNQRLIKDGKTLESPQDNQGELLAQARALEKRLPSLRALGLL